MKQFLMGNHILALASQEAGAKLMFGYPITPASEILEKWSTLAIEDKSLQVLQCEDEMAAGFATIGACLSGKVAFTATAGPGNTLMQDAFSMAESLRVPIVSMIMQRGGMSTSTVIYSQEEVRLTCFGGNGEGLRIVYSPSNLQELYDYTFKAFEVAWKYRFPTFLLADGYQGKMMGKVDLNPQKITINPQPILKYGVNLRNCYNLEEEVAEVLINYLSEYKKVRLEIEEAKEVKTQEAEIIVVAHGIVAAATESALDLLWQDGLKVGLFRPITLRPFPVLKAEKSLSNAKKIIVIESADGQLTDLLKREVMIKSPLLEFFKPAEGFTPEEIYERIKQLT